jgi:hypothetical protein
VTRPRLRPLSNEQKLQIRRRLMELRSLKAKVDMEIYTLELQLTRAAKGRTPRKELEHGTDSGYLWHLRKGVPFPEDHGGEECGCREAHRIYQAWLRHGRRAGAARP